MPSLKMFRGRTEVTDEFEHSIVETVIGEKGLEEVSASFRYSTSFKCHLNNLMKTVLLM